MTMRAQQIAINTDLLWDVACSPSIGFEMTVGEKSTIALGGFFMPKPYGLNVKAWGLQPEWRYWFSGRPMHRHFVGVGAIFTDYDTTIDERVRTGTGVGAGITFGYAFDLGKRITLNLHAGFGAIYYNGKEYTVGDDFDEHTAGNAVKANASGVYFLPTSIGVSFSYMLK